MTTVSGGVGGHGAPSARPIVSHVRLRLLPAHIRGRCHGRNVSPVRSQLESDRSVVGERGRCHGVTRHIHLLSTTIIVPIKRISKPTSRSLQPPGQDMTTPERHRRPPTVLNASGEVSLPGTPPSTQSTSPEPVEKCLLQLTVPGAAMRAKPIPRGWLAATWPVGSVYCSKHFQSDPGSPPGSKDATTRIAELTTYIPQRTGLASSNNQPEDNLGFYIHSVLYLLCRIIMST
jgi:hypothetical protein